MPYIVFAKMDVGKGKLEGFVQANVELRQPKDFLILKIEQGVH